MEPDIRLSDASDAAGEQVTVELESDGADVWGYRAEISYDASVVDFVAASGVDLPDPQVTDESGTLDASASQSSGVGGPTLAELTFELTGSAGDSTQLSFDESNTELAAGDEIVQPSAYRAGTVDVGEGDPGECDLPGDVDGDGQVSSLDATKTQQQIAGLEPGNFDEACAVFNGDDQITPADVTPIHQTTVGTTV
ncbi:cohesin domain-containing protein [Halovivax limisalsi]|uniref:cohesin domain-containing protein n=1 Tax=Halovivax limisalsi TaxID=1453760 RepID=UPI001FFC6C59|nr:cohesin domain-containing protein [Halovivax limisalsi]